VKPRSAPTCRGVVYSTDRGRTCPACGRALAQCTCSGSKRQPAGDGIVRIGRQTQGRKGKGVTVITGVPLAGTALEELAAQLKRRCGSGGTVRDGTIEIQGDHRDLLVAELGRRGWTVKRSGG
jgi:translation initiation factor 1